ncbi:MAG TPA: hypothetical protein DDW30_00780 [Clostridiales bacterium]|nr:hypothetical protein [Clostridiales bacterium]
MKIKCLSLTLCLCLLIGMALPLASCKKSEPTPPEGTYTRMTVDINPSVEFMVDDQNKVVSVTALNDDGSILIAGEAFVGKTPEEATQLVVSLATDAGYLVKGEIHTENTDESQKVEISVSGNSDYAKELVKNVTSDVEKYLKDNKITAEVEFVKAKTLEEMRKAVVADGLFTEDEVKDMTEEQLYKALAAGRIETAELLTAEMREAYYRAKDYKISFVEKQTTADIISSMDTAYSATYKLLVSGYSTALVAYSSSIESLDLMRYTLLVDPDSTYQRALASLRDAKEDLLKEKKLILSVKNGDENYAEISASFKLSEATYNKALKAVEDAGDAANQAMEEVLKVLREAEKQLKDLEDKLLENKDISAKLTAEAESLEAILNQAKDDFFAEFEAAHKSDIEKAESDLKAKKQELIAAAKG